MAKPSRSPAGGTRWAAAVREANLLIDTRDMNQVLAFDNERGSSRSKVAFSGLS
ncbi:MAG: hypothetical protein ABIZ92_16105 [Vicinamibacterales bacterium]